MQVPLLPIETDVRMVGRAADCLPFRVSRSSIMHEMKIKVIVIMYNEAKNAFDFFIPWKSSSSLYLNITFRRISREVKIFVKLL